MLPAGLVYTTYAHDSVKQVEDQIRGRDRYVELVTKPVSDFSLKSYDENEVKLKDFRGKAVILNFIYTRCREECPLHSRLIAKVQKQLAAAKLGHQVQFITIATDTEEATSTAKEMRDHGSHHGLDPANWVILAGGAGRERAGMEIASDYGLKFTSVGEGFQMHGVVTHLIDAEGRLRGRYHGLRVNPVSITMHVAAIINGDHHSIDTKIEDHVHTEFSTWYVKLIFGVTVAVIGLLLYQFLSKRRQRARRVISPTLNRLEEENDSN